MFLIDFLYIFIIILVIVFSALVIKLINDIVRGYAPFVRTKDNTLDIVLENIDLGKDFKGNVCELGCGEADFLKRIKERYPQARCLGLEYSFIPYLKAKLHLGKKFKDIKIRRKNFFKVNLSPENLIYCFLNNLMMKKVENKIKSDCRKGTILISYAFPFPGLNPYKEIIVNDNQDKVYFYKV